MGGPLGDGRDSKRRGGPDAPRDGRAVSDEQVLVAPDLAVGVERAQLPVIGNSGATERVDRDQPPEQAPERVADVLAAELRRDFLELLFHLRAEGTRPCMVAPD